jgi:nitroreductase
MAADEPSLDVWRDILGIARHAPSPHNVQPWRVRLVSGSEAELFIDGQRTLPKEDYTGSFLLSAMGMFLEAIDLLAAPHQRRLEYELRQTPAWFAEKARGEHTADLIPFAHLRLVAAGSRPIECSTETFLRRRTCRIPLHPTPVPADPATSLSGLAQRHGHVYLQMTDAAQIERVLARNIDAVFHDLNVASYHDEIAEWFRFTDRASRQHRDGLDFRCMNVSRSEFWLSARLSRLLLFPPTRAWLGRRYRRQLGTVPTIGILSGSFFVAENAVDSGRFLLRFWLEATRLGLYLHPYGNLVTNPDAAAWFQREVDLEDIWLVFKIGYADEPPESYRRALDAILVP